MNLLSSFTYCCRSNRQSELNRSDIEDKHYEIRALFIGDSKVGKSSIIDAMNSKPFKMVYRESHVFDFQKFQIIDQQTNSHFNFSLWEISVQNSISRMLSNVQIIYLVFSFDDEHSFKYLKKQRRQRIKQTQLDITSPTRPTEFLIGNKKDIEDKKVDTDVASKYAQKNNMIYLEISCLNNSDDIKNLINSSTSVFKNRSVLQQRSSDYSNRVNSTM